MSLSIEVLSGLEVGMIRAALPSWVASHVDAGPEVRGPLEAELGALVGGASDDELRSLQAAFVDVGQDYRFYPAHPLARRITRIYMRALTPAATLEEGGVRRFLAEGPTRRMIVCNHLSYTDTQVTDVVLADRGLRELADSLVAVAGPKVYTEAWRRMASVSLNTRKTAQSSAVATEQDALSARELAAVAFETLRDCERLMDEGYVILLYPEGTRSRAGQLQPFLRASHRYLSLPGLQVLPLAQTGTEAMFPVDEPSMFVAPVRLAFGEPFQPAAHPGRTGGLEEAWRRVAGLLPPAYAPPAGQPAVG